MTKADWRWTDLRVGDAVPAAPGPAEGGIIGIGLPRWHALTCRPQQEATVEAWLLRHGITRRFHPVEERTVVRYGRERTYERRYLPGYVFARFPGPALRHRLLDCPQLTGAVMTTSGEWGCLDPWQLKRIIAMRKVDREERASRAKERAHRRALNRLAPGDRALVEAGVFSGIEVEVAELGQYGATFRIGMVGTSVLHSLPLDLLRKIGD